MKNIRNLFLAVVVIAVAGLLFVYNAAGQKPGKGNSCTGIGIAYEIGEGQCKGKKAPAALVAKAKQDAQKQANKHCPHGKCMCEPQVIGEWCHNIEKNNQHIWIVTASCDGECSK